MKILYRYFIKEIFYTVMVITSIVVFIFWCSQFFLTLDKLSQSNIPFDLLIYFIMLQMFMFFWEFIPMGFFLGLLLFYGRLYSDSEMTALFASGFSKLQLLRFTFILSLIIAVIAGAANFFLNPILIRQFNSLSKKKELNISRLNIIPNQFKSFNSGGNKQIYYAENISHSYPEKANNIFLVTRIKDNHGVSKWSVTFSKKAYFKKINNQNFLITQDGQRYVGQPGGKEYQITRYKTYGLGFQLTNLSHIPIKFLKFSSVIKLFPKAFYKKDYAAEFQWRFSFSLAIIILGLLAVSMSRVNLRYRKFSQLIPAVLIAIIYINFIVISKGWVHSGTIPITIGIWWVHLVLFLLVLILIINWLRS